jgi:hypothetical protein
MATETTITSAAAWRPDVSVFAAGDAVPDALILQASTPAGEVDGDAPAVRVAYVDDAAATFTAEAADIGEANPGLSEVLVYTGKITQIVRLSNEQYRQFGTAGQLSESVRRAVIKKSDTAFLTQLHPASASQTVTISGSPTGGTFKLTSGNGAQTATIAFNAAAATVQTAVQALGGGYATAAVTGSAGGPYAIVTGTAAGLLLGDGSGLTGGTLPAVTTTPAGTGTTPPAGLMQLPGIVNGGAVATSLDALVDAIATLEGNGSRPSHIVLDPIGWPSSAN